MQNPALVLNADYQPLSYFPLSLICWQDAVKGVYEQTHVVVETYDAEVRSPTVTMKLPSVLAVKTFVPRQRRVAFTRFNVFLRDHFRCQYCSGKHGTQDLTFDHVIPVSRGGRTRWDNIVAACERCNTRKGHGQDMRPLTQPHEPTPGELMRAQRLFPPNFLHETWRDYLYWDSEIES